MGQSILVFVSHSSEDKEALIEPIVKNLEDCYINVWLDRRKIVPGENLRKSIFRDGLDKADVALIFFTENSLKSSWVDSEIKHVLREEKKKGNNFDINKIISIFDSQSTYNEISERYPELTDDLLHVMPADYSKIQLGQLISAIWSKYLSLQGGDIAVQKQLLSKDKELFQKDIQLQEFKEKVKSLKEKNNNSALYDEFDLLIKSGKITNFINDMSILNSSSIDPDYVKDLPSARAFGLVIPDNSGWFEITEKGRDLYKWYFLNNK